MAATKRSLLIGGAGAALLSGAWAAPAQQTSNTVIGPPQLKDFRLESRRPAVDRPVVPLPTPAPAPTTNQAAPAPPPPAATQRPVTTQPVGPATQPRPQPSATTRPPPAAAPVTAPAVQAPRPTAAQPAPTTGVDAVPPPAARVPLDQPASEPAPTPEQDRPATPAAPSAEGTPYFYYVLPVALLVLLGGLFWRRRRRSTAIAQAVEAGGVPAPVLSAAPPSARPVTPPTPRPDPIPRPWLEFALTAERASFTDTEAEVMFELEIANKGGSPARNLRIDIKMFNAGAEQDKEIGAFFKTAGRESTKLNLPGVDAGVTGVIKGRVTMAREDMKALRMDERLLFIPVIAVNGLYDWGDGRTGQTSKSYVIGREVEQAGEKMGAFRVDQGPRIWRTVGQRPHKLAKKV